MRSKKKWSAFDVASMGVMLAIIEVCKRALDFIPNLELVSFLFIVFTLTFGWRMLFLTWAFSTIEAFYFGVGVWVIAYFYVWPILVIVVQLTRKIGKENPWFYAILSGGYGLFFGFLCSLYTLVVGGVKMQLTWWVAGIPYDIFHCVGNFLICLFLFKPVMIALKRIVSNSKYEESVSVVPDDKTEKKEE